MRRFHVHIRVRDLDANIRFYSRLFGAEPMVRKPDYAKWMVDDPRVNFAISTSEAHDGVSHLGLEAVDGEELADIQSSFMAADSNTADEPNAACCYARADKHWATDPQGIRWEGFHSRGLLEDEVAVPASPPRAVGCCAPRAAVADEPAARGCG